MSPTRPLPGPTPPSQRSCPHAHQSSHGYGNLLHVRSLANIMQLCPHNNLVRFHQPTLQMGREAQPCTSVHISPSCLAQVPPQVCFTHSNASFFLLYTCYYFVCFLVLCKPGTGHKLFISTPGLQQSLRVTI